MDLKLQDKVIIVSGGARGIGEGIVQVLAKEGAIPFIVGRNAADNEAAVAAVEAAGGKALHVVAELTAPEACAAAVQAVLATCGRIDDLAFALPPETRAHLTARYGIAIEHETVTLSGRCARCSPEAAAVV